MNFPETKYAMNGHLAVAYQVFGEGSKALKGVPDEWRLFAVGA